MGREIDIDIKAQIRHIHSKRDEVEKEIESRMQALPAHIGLDKPLVDSSGFPRSDVDVAAVRGHRQRILMLTNDHKALTRQLDSLLQELHAHAKPSQVEHAKVPSTSAKSSASKHEADQRGRTSGTSHALSRPSEAGWSTAARPFAVVEQVSESSPGSAAGIQSQDRLVAFGTVTAMSLQQLQSIAKLLQERKGLQVKVVVLRRGSLKELDLVPNHWQGSGLLGCQLRLLA